MSPRGAGDPLAGSTVIVTGASSGLGASLAEAFAKAGAHVVLFARTAVALEQVAARCRALGPEPLVVAGDVTSPQSCESLVERAIERFGRLDVVVACAGLGMWARFDALEDPALLRRIMDVNYLGVAYPFFHALPHLERSGGMAVAISSVQGKVGVPFHSGYAASKHAVQGLCDSLRLELSGKGVQVLTVLAHWIRGTKLRERALGQDGAPRGTTSAGHGSSAVAVEDVTRAVLGAIRRRRRSCFVPGYLRLFACLSELAPGLADRLILRAVTRESRRH